MFITLDKKRALNPANIVGIELIDDDEEIQDFLPDDEDDFPDVILVITTVNSSGCYILDTEEEIKDFLNAHCPDLYRQYCIIS